MTHVVLGAYPRDLEYAGGTVITVVGQGFGASAIPGTTVLIGPAPGTPCLSTTWISDTLLRCSAPPVTGDTS